MDNIQLRTRIGEHDLKPTGCSKFCFIDRRFCPLFRGRNDMTKESGWWSGTTSNKVDENTPEYELAPRAFPLGATPEKDPPADPSPVSPQDPSPQDPAPPSDPDPVDPEDPDKEPDDPIADPDPVDPDEEDGDGGEEGNG